MPHLLLLYKPDLINIYQHQVCYKGGLLIQEKYQYQKCEAWTNKAKKLIFILTWDMPKCLSQHDLWTLEVSNPHLNSQTCMLTAWRWCWGYLYQMFT
ncbi:unnamed protein product [Moneuplotes crassus]|uniref:Uncharacterized protein n=1 Tax=Euplotes crassus TaxID=5936 RepID=A0AAD1X6S7_EUPCR|nr:unnamed protein product [Moneuplotes crassus]